MTCFHLSETISSSGWYDGSDYRYLKAGAIDMVIQRYVSFHVLDKELKVALKDATQKSQASSLGKNTVTQKLARRTSVVEDDNAKNDKVGHLACPYFTNTTHKSLFSQADQQTVQFTQSPKVCFFGYQTKLLTWRRQMADAPGWSGTFGRALLFPLKPFATRGIFDTWSHKVTFQSVCPPQF